VHAKKHLGLAFALTLVAACGGNETTSSTTSTSSTSGTGGAPGTTSGTTSASTSTSSAGGAGGGVADLTVQTYRSDVAGPAVDSHLILGSNEAVLVDGQFFKADAAKVIALVNASGKTLTTVFLTHAHPDHYLGLEPIHAAFPLAKVVTTAAVLAEFKARSAGTFMYLKTSFADQIADALTTPEVLTGDTIAIDGQALAVIEAPHAGESGSAAALALPGKKALIAGDVVYHDVHLVLAECAWQGWLDNLTAVKAMGFETFYPGHGAKTDATTLDADAAYIQAVVPIMDGAASADEAKAAIKVKYPTDGSDFLLGFSVDNYFAGCKKAP
jgi:glyoxylase-like metal-dependent hydrolase (beta-lactamase superfamily II)